MFPIIALIFMITFVIFMLYRLLFPLWIPRFQPLDSFENYVWYFKFVRAAKRVHWKRRRRYVKMVMDQYERGKHYQPRPFDYTCFFFTGKKREKK